ncbi:type II toxin-antitoxin system HipA family toxin [Pelagibacterium luteolum]|uniref:Serine/threonine-protein kinase HipA n=1 Tax=Pelagibacterium luteolum TaxID=440168 RepID=A0A1G7ZZY2_9HYPH|nr:HipA domain-containing protein [Pelagibacterium luteolum]SDH14228.1 serine/threonine-protein kinase HipA [Pelagibacterium luteolum]
MNLDIEIFLADEWHRAANLFVHEPALGYRGPVTLDYDPQYFLDHASIDYSQGHPARDIRALSVRLPVDLASRYTQKWPPFLLDLIPQGHARRQLALAMGLEENSRAADLPLLLRASGNTIGNIRIAQAEQEERQRLASSTPVGVTWGEMLERSERFMEVFDRFMMIASGSSGLQGEWPKVAMTQSADGLYYPDPIVADDQAMDHVIVKLLRSDKATDRDILRLEGLYSSIAAQIGLNVKKAGTYAPGVLIVPRFDRKIVNGRTIRFGQESIVSALGVSEFGYVGTHESYIEVIKSVSTDPDADVIEYVLRDIANLAMGNTDNHGRNTAIEKYTDGTVRLAPVFDFAPMRLADETIVRSTRWECMKSRGGDTLPNWQVVCDAVYPNDKDRAGKLLASLVAFGERLNEVPKLVASETRDIEPSISRALSRFDEIRKSLTVNLPTLVKR